MLDVCEASYVLLFSVFHSFLPYLVHATTKLVQLPAFIRTEVQRSETVVC